jgi:hypothetical protein
MFYKGGLLSRKGGIKSSTSRSIASDICRLPIIIGALRIILCLRCTKIDSISPMDFSESGYAYM